jgi:hypothetical protein
MLRVIRPPDADAPLETHLGFVVTNTLGELTADYGEAGQ